ncbi:MAG: O-antigen ligase family protein [Candidatus Rifleibacteriota bacterium]
MAETHKMTLASLDLWKNSPAARLLAWSLLLFAIVGNFSISLSQISLGLALISTVILHRRGELELRPAPLAAPFMFIALAGLLSVFVAGEKMRALTEMKKFFVILVFYLAWWPPISADFKKKLLTGFVITATLTSILALHNVAMGKMLNDRARGFFSTSITFGECQAMVAIVIITWLLAGTATRKGAVGLAVSGLLVIASMISTMSRGAWLGFAAGLLVLMIRFPRRMLPIMFAVALVSAPVIWFTPALRSRIEAFDIRKNLEAMSRPMTKEDSAAMVSNYLRMNIWQQGFRMTENRSVFGVGLNNVKKEFYELASDYEKQHDFLIFGHQHSNFMQFYAMTGLLGLCAFFIFLVTVFKFLLNFFPADNWNTRMAMGSVAVFTAFILTGLTEYSWGDEEVAMMAFFIVGILSNQNDSQPEN